MDNKRTILQDDKTRDRIHEHLANPSDVISDDDIKQAKTDSFDEVTASPGERLPDGDDKDEQKTNSDENDGDAGGGMVTPWNILGA